MFRRAFGRFEAEAVNEPGHIVVADVFQLTLDNETLTPAAEIDEIFWFQPSKPSGIPMVALSEFQILPLYWQMQFNRVL